MNATKNYANKQLKKERTKTAHPVRNGKAGGKGQAKKVRKERVSKNGPKGGRSAMGKAKKPAKKVAK